MRAKKELSSILWLNNTVMLVQFALLAYGYLYNPHTVQLQLMKPTPTLLGCMVVADFLFRAGTVVWLFCNRWVGHRAIQGNGPAAIRGNGLAAIQGNGPVAIQGNGPVAIQGNGPAAIQGNGPAAIQGNGPVAIQSNGPVAIQGNGPEEAAGSTFHAPIEAITSGMPSAIVLSIGQTHGYNGLSPHEELVVPPISEALTLGETSALVCNNCEFPRRSYHTSIIADNLPAPAEPDLRH